MIVPNTVTPVIGLLSAESLCHALSPFFPLSFLQVSSQHLIQSSVGEFRNSEHQDRSVVEMALMNSVP